MPVFNPETAESLPDNPVPLILFSNEGDSS